jgi:DNA-directed RNA polymerase subunit K
MNKYTVYERARLIGARALQISQGAPLKVELSQEQLQEIGYNPIEIAKIELKEGVMPLDIRRKEKKQAK